MKKLVLFAFILCSLGVFAQEEKAIVIEKDGGEKSTKKQTQEIVIRSKGDKDKKITVEINGEKITINGKSIAEFKDDDITINKRNITIFDGKNRMLVEPRDMEVFFDGPMKGRLQTSSPSAFLGVSTAVINDNQNDTKPNGASITNVTKESAADKAGLKVDDIITKIDDKKIESPQDLTEVISSKKPKDEITITYKREGKVSTTKATLGERKGGPLTYYSFSSPNGSRSFSLPRTPDMALAPNWEGGKGFDSFNFDFNDDVDGKFDSYFNNAFPNRKKIGLKIQDIEEGSGVKVLDTDDDSPAQKAGLKKDDIITEINGKAVNNTDEARELLKPEEGKNNFTIKAKRNGTAMSFDVKIPKKLKTANL
jgi:serine protease Do